jgi:hypothetical protein
MDLAQLNLRRSFETDVAEQLEQQLPKKSRLLTLFNRFDLGSKRNKSTIDGMGDRIARLKTLVSLPRLAGVCRMPGLANVDISETFKHGLIIVLRHIFIFVAILACITTSNAISIHYCCHRFCYH